MSRDVIQSESRPVIDGYGAAEHHPENTRFGKRVRVLAAETREVREPSKPPPSSAADRRVLECARDGIGLAVSFHVSAWAGDRQVSFTGKEFELLHRMTNDWLAMYARCYGVDSDADFTAREAAEVLLWTRGTVDTAQLLTCAPEQR